MDTEWMQQAILLSQQARMRAPPNPWVGCVLVKDGSLVGKGATQKPGLAHAEIEALEQAGTNARGATAYVTLEPCAHHGRTPPCSDALITAGVARVVIAMLDPDPRVRGRGIEQLKNAGIEVSEGVCSDQVATILRPYIHHRTTGLPYCILKIAVSIDGRIAASDGSSRWISCEEARADAHRLRAESQAILIGAGTALRDRPALTVREYDEPGIQQPLRVLLDPRGRVPAEGPLFDVQQAPTLVITTEQAPARRRDEWGDAGAQVTLLEQTLDLKTILKLLGSQGIVQVLAEGGSQIHSSLIKAQLFDQLTVYFGACLLGDQGVPFTEGLGIKTIGDAKRLELIGTAQLGSTIRANYTQKT